ncbi:TSA1-like protein [Cucumis melo var. makuwa]|uniref:TSA1-like protein n=1 Tax=Cucumis melo var. makuwa TaxID=1194695 RepID=A0A5A7UY16_CUCMM|nr:TSA1-like protein [Cucumis melo var. makuwa]TYK14100.1 TSA1-like protein [Cucumis melo var. makuwa]
MAEEVLVAKEVKMRKEIESKNKEYEFLQSKYEFLRLKNLTHKSMVDQDNIEVDPKGFRKCKETIEESKEMESEIQQLKKLYMFEYFSVLYLDSEIQQLKDRTCLNISLYYTC